MARGYYVIPKPYCFPENISFTSQHTVKPYEA